MMNFIDIASWQKGMDLNTMFKQNPLDGVMVKLTEGTGYVNPEAHNWLEWLKVNEKPFGTYHFLVGGDAKGEAHHYCDNVCYYRGGVLCLDYEADALKYGAGYLKECLDEVYRIMGVKPIVYCSLSVTKQSGMDAIAKAGYKLWIAQYADNNPVEGFLEKPWQSGSVAPFDAYIMHQYTSHGVLKGWSNKKMVLTPDNSDSPYDSTISFTWEKLLDLDQFRGSVKDWNALAGKTESPAEPDAPETPDVLKDPDAVVVSEVLAGRYGEQADRAANLRAAGYDPEKVQDKINELYGIAQSCNRYITGNEEYLSSITKIIRLL